MSSGKQNPSASSGGQSVRHGPAVAVPPCGQHSTSAAATSVTSSASTSSSSTSSAAAGGGATARSHSLTAAQQWENVITDWYPRLEERAYFVPSVHFNKVHYDRQHVGGRHVPQTDHVPVLVPQPPVADRRRGDQSVSESDIRDDRTTQRLLACLRALADRQKEVMFVLSQLDFGDYLGEPCYSAAASVFARPIDLKKKKKKKKKTKTQEAEETEESLHEGDFDLLIFHREYGVLVGEVKTVGDNFSSLTLTQQQQDAIVVKKVEQAVKQLNKTEKVLRHLLSNLQPPPRVRKSVMLPNIARSQLQRVLRNNPQLEQAVCQCMAIQSGVNPVDMCLCADNLSHTATPFDVTDDVMTKLLQWWGHVMTGDGPDTSFKTHYRCVVARFAGPATTVQVFSVSKPRLHVHTEGEAVSETGCCFTQIVLHPVQLDVLHQDQPLVYLAGAPGTGKTLVLVLRAVKWLHDGHHVHIVSLIGGHSLAAAYMIDHQVRQMAGPLAQHTLHLHVTDAREKDQRRNSVQYLVTRVDSRGRLFVIADECDIIDDFVLGGFFTSFCGELHGQVNELHLWSASCSDRDIPACLTKVTLSEPLRSPPVVVREISQSEHFTFKICPAYRESSAPPLCDGPPVRYVRHTAGRDGHSGDEPGDCQACGAELASLLCTDLRVGVTTGPRTGSTAVSPQPLRYRDALVVSRYPWTDDVTDETGKVVRPASGFVRGLRQGGVPVRVVRSDDVTAIAEMAVMGGDDDVVVANMDVVAGLERPVVVVVGGLIPEYLDEIRFSVVSRCTSQLVLVKKDSP
ncbi:uncharacterized protein [Littorina saxatilis]|uniref:uncharacterized protein n=1 Tax=Littorina saxatilis TaxID=31220 RepID=UPI0038B48D17